MLNYNAIYKNGKVDRFFIKIDRPEEFNFIQPYFLKTSIDHPRSGRIYSMECLFSGLVWHGKQGHGYGYSSSADVFGELQDIIMKMYKKELSEEEKKEIFSINVHNDSILISDSLLEKLAELNSKKLVERLNNI